MTNVGNIVCVVAHPDDAELLCYGTLRRAARSGTKVTVIIVSTGVNGVSLADTAAGTKIQGLTRVAESNDAYAGTGIDVVCLGFQDGALKADRALISAIEQALVERECHALLTHSPSARNDHQDHLAVAAAALNAVVRIPTCRIILHGEPHSPRSEFKPNYLVDITDYIDDKIVALGKHSTQAGRWYLSEQFTRDRAAAAGWRLAPHLAAEQRYFEAFECSLMVIGEY
ncbi:PIG-L deacetylase family protein [Nocardia gipuzkoensis]